MICVHGSVSFIRLKTIIPLDRAISWSPRQCPPKSDWKPSPLRRIEVSTYEFRFQPTSLFYGGFVIREHQKHIINTQGCGNLWGKRQLSNSAQVGVSGFLSNIHVIIWPQNRFSWKSSWNEGYHTFSEKRIGWESSEHEPSKVEQKSVQDRSEFYPSQRNEIRERSL